MAKLQPVDKVEIQVLVDNATDGLSTTPSNVENEFAFATRRGLRASSGRCLCCAVHGFSVLLTATRGDKRHSVLFDSGPEDFAFERNTARLGADLGQVESIVLSHGHWDHSGAMFLALNAIRSRNGQRVVPYYAHPGMFRSRAMRLPNGSLRYLDDVPSSADLTAQGADVICITEPRAFLDDHALRARPARAGAQDRGWQQLGAGRAPDGRAVAWGKREGQGPRGVERLLAPASSTFSSMPARTSPTCRFTRWWAGCISPGSMRRSYRRRSKRCVSSASRRLPPAIALAGVPSRRSPRPSATRCWRQRRSGSGTRSKGLWITRKGRETCC